MSSSSISAHPTKSENTFRLVVFGTESKSRNHYLGNWIGGTMPKDTPFTSSSRRDMDQAIFKPVFEDEFDAVKPMREVTFEVYNVKRLTSKVIKTIWPCDAMVLTLPFNFDTGGRFEKIETFLSELCKFVDQSSNPSLTRVRFFQKMIVLLCARFNAAESTRDSSKLVQLTKHSAESHKQQIHSILVSTVGRELATVCRGKCRIICAERSHRADHRLLGVDWRHLATAAIMHYCLEDVATRRMFYYSTLKRNIPLIKAETMSWAKPYLAFERSLSLEADDVDIVALTDPLYLAQEKEHIDDDAKAEESPFGRVDFKKMAAMAKADSTTILTTSSSRTCTKGNGTVATSASGQLKGKQRTEDSEDKEDENDLVSQLLSHSRASVVRLEEEHSRVRSRSHSPFQMDDNMLFDAATDDIMDEEQLPKSKMTPIIESASMDASVGDTSVLVTPTPDTGDAAADHCGDDGDYHGGGSHRQPHPRTRSRCTVALSDDSSKDTAAEMLLPESTSSLEEVLELDAENATTVFRGDDTDTDDSESDSDEKHGGHQRVDSDILMKLDGKKSRESNERKRLSGSASAPRPLESSSEEEDDDDSEEPEEALDLANWCAEYKLPPLCAKKLAAFGVTHPRSLVRLPPSIVNQFVTANQQSPESNLTFAEARDLMSAVRRYARLLFRRHQPDISNTLLKALMSWTSKARDLLAQRKKQQSATGSSVLSYDELVGRSPAIGSVVVDTGTGSTSTPTLSPLPPARGVHLTVSSSLDAFSLGLDRERESVSALTPSGSVPPLRTVALEEDLRSASAGPKLADLKHIDVSQLRTSQSGGGAHRTLKSRGFHLTPLSISMSKGTSPGLFAAAERRSAAAAGSQRLFRSRHTSGSRTVGGFRSDSLPVNQTLSDSRLSATHLGDGMPPIPRRRSSAPFRTQRRDRVPMVDTSAIDLSSVSHPKVRRLLAETQSRVELCALTQSRVNEQMRLLTQSEAAEMRRVDSLYAAVIEMISSERDAVKRRLVVEFKQRLSDLQFRSGIVAQSSQRLNAAAADCQLFEEQIKVWKARKRQADASKLAAKQTEVLTAAVTRATVDPLKILATAGSHPTVEYGVRTVSLPTVRLSADGGANGNGSVQQTFTVPTATFGAESSAGMMPSFATPFSAAATSSKPMAFATPFGALQMAAPTTHGWPMPYMFPALTGTGAVDGSTHESDDSKEAAASDEECDSGLCFVRLKNCPDFRDGGRVQMLSPTTVRIFKKECVVSNWTVTREKPLFFHIVVKKASARFTVGFLRGNHKSLQMPNVRLESPFAVNKALLLYSDTGEFRLGKKMTADFIRELRTGDVLYFGVDLCKEEFWAQLNGTTAKKVCYAHHFSTSKDLFPAECVVCLCNLSGAGEFEIVRQSHFGKEKKK